MEVKVERITTPEEMKRAIAFAYSRNSSQSLPIAYQREHSIIRLNIFRIYLKDIPSKVSVHLVRHATVGQYHLVGSNRGDWNDRSGLTIEEWDKKINRGTPVNHYMVVNAQHLIDMGRKRLCIKAEAATRDIMERIKHEVSLVDKDLAEYIVPNCWYRGGICSEDHACPMYTKYQDYIGYKRRSTI